MGAPSVIPRVANTLKTRVSNTRGFAVGATTQQIAGYDNNRTGVIIQNLDAVNALRIGFTSSSNDTVNTFFVPPTGQISFDFTVGEQIFAFSPTGAVVQGVILEVTGFDTFQMLVAKLLESCSDQLEENNEMLRAVLRGRR